MLLKYHYGDVLFDSPEAALYLQVLSSTHIYRNSKFIVKGLKLSTPSEQHKCLEVFPASIETINSQLSLL